MPTRHNKKRYQAKAKPKVQLTCAGRIFLQYRDEEAMEQAVKGDLLLHASADALHTVRQGEYWSTGVAGYFKVDVYDGKRWQPVLLNDLFPGREHYFSKRECPIDTFTLCSELLTARMPLTLTRTYREHYALAESAPEEE